MSAPSGPALVLDGVSKSFGEVKALRSVSAEVAPGSSLALVGPDGAGKTTLFRLVCGLVAPDAGAVRVLGLDPRGQGERVRPLLGYLSQGFSLYGDLSVDENIAFFAEIHGVAAAGPLRDSLLERMGLAEFRSRLAERLSGGMKQKLALACALVHSPRLLLLDEPTTGVDPVSRREFWLILSELRSEGMAMVLATPYLDEAERCDRVVLLHEGSVLAAGRPRELTAALAGRIVEVACSPPRRARADLLAGGWQEVQLFGDRVNVLVQDEQREIPAIRRRLEQAGVAVAGMRVVPARLENVFVSRLGGAAAARKEEP